MAYRVELLPSAVAEFAALPPRPRRQVARRIDALQEDSRPRGSRVLRDRGEGLRRIRSGDYRILYRVKDEVLLVLVVKVGDRRDVYRGL